VLSMRLTTNNNPEPVYGWRGQLKGFRSGRPTHHASLELDCDAEFFEVLVEWLRRQGVSGELPALPMGDPELPP
jgi:hypothetical protein